MAVNKRDIEFLFEIGSLRNVQRAWRQQMGVDVANNLEHSFRVAFTALIIARMEGIKSEEKIMKMALMHDLEESKTGDHTRFQKPYVKIDKDKANREVFEGTSLVDFDEELYSECKKMQSAEAKIVKDADMLDIDLELRELEERNHQIPKKWKKHRQEVRRNELHTESARELFDAIWEADVSDWYGGY